MATEIGRVVIYGWKSGNLRWGDARQLFTGPFDDLVTWQMKNLITAFPQYR